MMIVSRKNNNLSIYTYTNINLSILTYTYNNLSILTYSYNKISILTYTSFVRPLLDIILLYTLDSFLTTFVSVSIITVLRYCPFFSNLHAKVYYGVE